MNLQPGDFQGMMDFPGMKGSTLIHSPTDDVRIARQAALSEYRREMNVFVSQMDNEVTDLLLGPYQKPSQELLTKVGNTLAIRELALENPQFDMTQDLIGSPEAMLISREDNFAQKDSWLPEADDGPAF